MEENELKINEAEEWLRLGLRENVQTILKCINEIYGDAQELVQLTSEEYTGQVIVNEIEKHISALMTRAGTTSRAESL